MKYLLLIYHNDQQFWSMPDDAKQKVYMDFRALREELVTSGKWVAGSQLKPASTATTVRVKNEKPLTTDGPFAETKEQLGGFFMVETETREEAEAIAARIPSARLGSIEVRELAQ